MQQLNYAWNPQKKELGTHSGTDYKYMMLELDEMIEAREDFSLVLDRWNKQTY
jgi:hypothetical protein